jgi:hypothetical protein
MKRYLNAARATSVLTAWLPLSCTWSSMNAAFMSFGPLRVVPE